MVLFPWLVAVMLDESATRVGFAQMCGALPALFLILFGGVVGDRFDQRRILIALHMFGALPPFVLAVLIGGNHLSYGLMIGYALIGGIVGAFSATGTRCVAVARCRRSYSAHGDPGDGDAVRRADSRHRPGEPRRSGRARCR